MNFGAADVGNNNGTYYLAPGYTATASGSRVGVTCNKAKTFTKMFVRHNVPAQSGGDITYTLKKNGDDTNLTATLAADASDTSVEAEVEAAEGDLLELVAVHGAITDGSVAATVSLKSIS